MFESTSTLIASNPNKSEQLSLQIKIQSNISNNLLEGQKESYSYSHFLESSSVCCDQRPGTCVGIAGNWESMNFFVSPNRPIVFNAFCKRCTRVVKVVDDGSTIAGAVLILEN